MIECEESKIRVIYTRLSEVAESKQQLKYLGFQVSKGSNFKKLKDILDAFANMQDQSTRGLLERRWDEVQQSLIQSENLKTPEDYFRNGITKCHRPVNLKPFTPLSQMSLSELPSPRVIIENERMKNARLLPHYDGPETVHSLSKEDYNRRRVSRNRSWQKVKTEVTLEGKIIRSSQKSADVIGEMRT